jgi:hypothetical protein
MTNNFLMILKYTAPLATTGHLANNFCFDAAEFCHWSLSSGWDMRTLKALFGQRRENFRNLWCKKGFKKMSKEIYPRLNSKFSLSRR